MLNTKRLSLEKKNAECYIQMYIKYFTFDNTDLGSNISLQTVWATIRVRTAGSLAAINLSSPSVL